MSVSESKRPVSATLADWITSSKSRNLPRAVADATVDSVIDTIGLAIAARNQSYVAALTRAAASTGTCTVFGFEAQMDASSAAMINGTAAHGEDFDNTFEGCPVHAAAVVVPAVLAAAEERSLTGADVARGIAVGQELMCRMGVVAGRAIHSACFHPTAVIGPLGAAAAIAGALGAQPGVTVNALGIAGSLASGIIEYLADGSWTKRLHAGWAAQSGLRAFALAEAGFTGPATVIDGVHGFYRAFAPSIEPQYSVITEELGRKWLAADVAFKPYASGTMTQPFIDCALALRREPVGADDIVELRCSVGEGTVHRLWEPLEDKRNPPTSYAAKFSTPYCIAVAFIRGDAGLAEFTDELIREPAVLALASKVVYEVDPRNEYPRNYSGRIRVTLKDGRTIDLRQPHLRGGAHQRLSREELMAKCEANTAFGGVSADVAGEIAQFAQDLVANDTPAAVSIARIRAACADARG